MNGKPEERMLSLAGKQVHPDVSPPRRGYQRQGYGEAIAKSFIRSVAASLGRRLVRMFMGRMR